MIQPFDNIPKIYIAYLTMHRVYIHACCTLILVDIFLYSRTDHTYLMDKLLVEHLTPHMDIHHVYS